MLLMRKTLVLVTVVMFYQAEACQPELVEDAASLLTVGYDRPSPNTLYVDTLRVEMREKKMFDNLLTSSCNSRMDVFMVIEIRKEDSEGWGRKASDIGITSNTSIGIGENLDPCTKYEIRVLIKPMKEGEVRELPIFTLGPYYELDLDDMAIAKFKGNGEQYYIENFKEEYIRVTDSSFTIQWDPVCARRIKVSILDVNEINWSEATKKTIPNDMRNPTTEVTLDVKHCTVFVVNVEFKIGSEENQDMYIELPSVTSDLRKEVLKDKLMEHQYDNISNVLEWNFTHLIDEFDCIESFSYKLVKLDENGDIEQLSDGNYGIFNISSIVSECNYRIWMNIEYKTLDKHVDSLKGFELNMHQKDKKENSISVNEIPCVVFETSATPSPEAEIISKTSCPTRGSCLKTDQRGSLWEGKFGNLTQQKCSQGSGTAKWYCNGCLHGFEGPQPDRSECVETWVLDIGKMISGVTANSLEVSETIFENTKPASEDNPGMTGGSIVALVNMYRGLLSKHDHEDGSTEDNIGFTNNIVRATSVLIKHEPGWNEIKSQSLRSKTFSRILSSMDNIGYIFGKSLQQNNSECVQPELVFPSKNVNLKVRGISASYTGMKNCFTFGPSGSICLPPAGKIDVNEDKPCSVHVASSFSIESEKSKYFQTNIRSAKKSIFGNFLIGLTIDNGSIGMQLPEDSEPIVVTFNHKENKDLYELRTCVFWNITSLSWSGEGCQFSPIVSDARTTVCHCRHLTNFGVLFDYVGDADPTDSQLSNLSLALLILSCLAILVTQALLFFLKSGKRSSTRTLVENSRNLTLFAAQLAFVTLAGQHNHVSVDMCQFFGALIHLLYLSFFAWTALEGYSFYSALVTVFDKKHLSSKMFYLLGFGVPILITMITMIVSLVCGYTLYLRMNAGGEVVACWLGVEAMPAIVVPADIFFLAFPCNADNIDLYSGLVFFANLGVTITCVYIAHTARNKRSMSSKSKILASMRNTILLSVLLGLTWLTALIPTSAVQQYMSVTLNASTGLYILAYSVLANKQIMGEVRERVSNMMSGAMSSTISGTMSTMSSHVSTAGSRS